MCVQLSALRYSSALKTSLFFPVTKEHWSMNQAFSQCITTQLNRLPEGEADHCTQCQGVRHNKRTREDGNIAPCTIISLTKNLQNKASWEDTSH